MVICIVKVSITHALEAFLALAIVRLSMTAWSTLLTDVDGRDTKYGLPNQAALYLKQIQVLLPLFIDIGAQLNHVNSQYITKYYSILYKNYPKDKIID